MWIISPIKGELSLADITESEWYMRDCVSLGREGSAFLGNFILLFGSECWLLRRVGLRVGARSFSFKEGVVESTCFSDEDKE